MIGISTQADDPQVYDKRSPNFRLTSEQKQRLHDAIEEEANGRVLDALERVIQEIRDEIDQMSHHMRRGEETSELPSGVFDHSMWTGCTSTPNNKPANRCSSPKIRSFADNNFEDTYGQSWRTRPRNFRTKSHGAWNATESDSDLPKASSNAGRPRCVGGYPGVIDRSILDFRQPPFPRHSQH
ncbi:GL13050 [Drosophila persimilis]|uniref:GL13050 n=1 Tax=Drosophila persimilis TaxID=7234 RepID=B4GUX0_DROPE|nr:GL13050 [Drosophila persimilis]